MGSTRGPAARSTLAVVAFAGLAVVTGCAASNKTTSPVDAAPAATATSPATAPPLPGSKADPVISVIPVPTSNLGLLPTVPESKASQLASVTWSLVAVGNPDDQVTVSVTGDGWLHVEGSQVQSGRDSVTVAVLADRPPGSATACAAEQVTVLAAVRLPEPLRGRTLLHSPTS